MDADLALFRSRLDGEDNAFKIEVLGRVMQIFLYDLWTVYQHGLAQMDTSEGRQGENTSRVFLRFLALAQQHARREREVGFYADKLCITPKYLSQISRSVTGLPASQWIQFYALHQESAGKIAKRISEAVRAKLNSLRSCRVAARYSGFAGSRPDIGVANTANNKPSAIFENPSAIWVTPSCRFRRTFAA